MRLCQLWLCLPHFGHLQGTASAIFLDNLFHCCTACALGKGLRPVWTSQAATLLLCSVVFCCWDGFGSVIVFILSWLVQHLSSRAAVWSQPVLWCGVSLVQVCNFLLLIGTLLLVYQGSFELNLYFLSILPFATLILYSNCCRCILFLPLVCWKGFQTLITAWLLMCHQLRQRFNLFGLSGAASLWAVWPLGAAPAPSPPSWDCHKMWGFVLLVIFCIWAAQARCVCGPSVSVVHQYLLHLFLCFCVRRFRSTESLSWKRSWKSSPTNALTPQQITALSATSNLRKCWNNQCVYVRSLPLHSFLHQFPFSRSVLLDFLGEFIKIN